MDWVDIGVVDVARLQAVIAEYGRLSRLEGCSPQRRGQRFNEVIADMLRCWGVEATTSIRTTGEIDVGFAVGGVRYVVEAKWEQVPANTGHVAKLQKRVRQRMAGTYGVFLSMSGYSKHALADVGDGERLEVLLLDASHFEAMLAGLVPPEEMMSLLHDRAAYYGEAFAPLATLLSSPVPAVTIGGGIEGAGLARSAVPGVGGEVVLTVPDSNQAGLACLAPSRLLVTTRHAILSADLAGGGVSAAVPVFGCHGGPLLDAEDAALFTRRGGVGRFRQGDVTVVAGGFAGDTSMIRQPGGDVWVFDSGASGTGTSLTRLGNRLGEEERFAHGYSPGSGTGACWLTANEIVVVGASGLARSTFPDGDVQWLRLPHQVASGPVTPTPNVIMTGGLGGQVLHTNLITGTTSEFAQLTLSGAVRELAIASDGNIFAVVSDQAGARGSQAIVRLRVPSATVPASAVAPPQAATPPAQATAVTSYSPPPATASVTAAQSSAPSRRQERAGWQLTRPDRGNRQGEFVPFSGRSGVYWAIVGLNTLLIMMILIVILATDTAIVAKILLGLLGAFLLAATVGFGRMASQPIRLEIGVQGIQVFSRRETVWFPWQMLKRIEIMRLEGGNPHLVGWCAAGVLFPDFDGFSGGPRYLQHLDAVAICPLNVLKARRHIVARALHTYGGNRFGEL